MGACCSSSGGGGGGGTTGVPASEGSACEAAASGAPGAAGGGGAGPTEAERRPADATSSSAFPSRAISLAHLFSLLDAKTIDAAWTAHEVKVKHVLPVTLATTTAYTNSPAGKDHSGETNLFVSHAWQYTFGSLVGALRNWATKAGADAATTYAWIDLFSVNQHVSQDVTQDEWAETFKNGIARAGRVVLVLTPWSNPIPYTRAWCLWEVFNASKTGARFEIALSSDEEQRLGDAVSEEPFGIVPALCEISSSKAEAQDPRDKEMIFSWITRPAAEGGAGGFRALDGLMLDLLREWLATVLAQLQEERSPAGAWEGDEEMIDFRGKLAVTYSALGRHAEALRLEEETLEASKATLGLGHLDTMRAMGNLAGTYSNLGRHEDALRLEEETLEARRAAHGPEHPNTLVAMGNLAMTYRELGRHDDAIQLEEATLEANKAVLGDDHPDTLRAMGNLAVTYSALGRHKDALRLREGTLEASKAALGSGHFDTLLAMGNLAATYSVLGRHDDALRLEEETLEAKRAALGAEHPDTLIAMGNLAGTYSDLGRHEDALRLEEETLEAMKTAFGPDNPNTLVAMGNLAVTYRDLGRNVDALRLEQEKAAFLDGGGGVGGGTTGVPASEGSACEAAASGAPGAAGGGGAGPTEAERRPADATSSSAFPSRAISLAHLFSLLDAKTIDAAWTAHEVKVKHVLPVTLATTTAYTNSPAGKDHSGETNLFVSHAWQYTFGSLVGALRNWATKAGADAATTYAWIDLFSVNQHVSLDVTQDEWAETFKNGIARAGRVVLVLTPWSNPIPYTRAWCLWEVFNASKTGARFEIALSSDEEQRLGDAVSEEPFGIVPALCEISSSKAEAQDPRDKEMIFSWITRPAAEGGAGGFRALDGLMLDLLREWLATVLAQLQEERSPAGAWEGDEEMIDFRGKLAVTYSALGRYEDALRLEEETLEASKATLGLEHLDTMRAMGNLAGTYSNLGRHEDALRLGEATREARRAAHGDDHPDTLRAMGNLADTYGELGRHDDALRLEEETLAAKKVTLGPDHPDTLVAMGNLAITYSIVGRQEDALRLQEETLAGSKAALGSEHPETLRAMGNLAATYGVQGRHDDALQLAEATLEASKAALGAEHPDTLIAMGNLAGRYSDLGRHEDALRLEEETLEAMKTTFGPDNPNTLVAMETLAVTYRALGRNVDALRLEQEKAALA